MREDIERALGGLLFVTGQSWEPEIDFGLLAESKDVIMIEAEVIHTSTPIYTPVTQIHFPQPKLGEGHIGTPGPYLFFGVPRPKENRKP